MENQLIELIEKRQKLKLTKITGGLIDEAVINENDDLFKAELREILKNNNKWLLLLFIFLIILTIFISAIIWQVQSNKTYVIALGGGQGIGIAAIITRMTKLYNRKRTSEILLNLYQNAKTEDERQKLLAEIIKVLKVE